MKDIEILVKVGGMPYTSGAAHNVTTLLGVLRYLIAGVCKSTEKDEHISIIIIGKRA